MLPRAFVSDTVLSSGSSWDRRPPIASVEIDSGLGCSTSRGSCCTQVSACFPQLNLHLQAQQQCRVHAALGFVTTSWRGFGTRTRLENSLGEEAHLPNHPPRNPLARDPSSLHSSHAELLGQLCDGRLIQRVQRRFRAGGVSAGLNDDKTDRSRATSSTPAPAFSTGSSVKFNRMESTLPLSATATSLQASIRVAYSLVAHAALVGFGCLICELSGADVTELIHLEPMDLVKGALLAFPPILLAWFLQLEFLVQKWEVARGVRDADDEELLEYYLGMAPSQYIPVAVASAVAQEVFFRAALQGGLALVFHLGGPASLGGGLLHGAFGGPVDAGMAAVSDHFTTFAPFSQLHAAVVMAVMTGTFDYATSTRSVPDVIVTDGRNLSSLKSTFGEWHHRQRLKSIYAPMFTALLALYFGLEWICVGNLVAPVVSHSLYLAWSMQAGLARLDRLKHQDQGMK